MQSTERLLYKPQRIDPGDGKPTDSDKTTTMASMINIINELGRKLHIITIEDPMGILSQAQSKCRRRPA